ncbi:hypothetical protein [Paraburkholderia sp. BL23I1N1]|uniref:hypothetical protein n=1 Tax=Paraburkholderia sp. BL23I1N1 TaxID=1938802 RepID=UPI0016046135|nr:hypothetical protein [Paraburkholderia sp. BL23I1N1]
MAATTHEAHEATNIPLDGSLDPNTDRDAHTSDSSNVSDLSGERAKGGDKKKRQV